jgi:hypothetical protein
MLVRLAIGWCGVPTAVEWRITAMQQEESPSTGGTTEGPPMITTALIIAAALAAAPAAPSAKAPPTIEEEKKICKTEAVTGSRMRGERRCLTSVQWEQIRLESQRAMKDSRRHTRGDPGN